jgi:hypothetical protein
MCPTSWPITSAAGEPQVGAFDVAKDAYLLNAFNGLGDRSAHIFHLLLGGQARPFGAAYESLDPLLRVTTRYVRIPMLRGGSFVQQRPATRIAGAIVHDSHAAVLREPPYPQGGLHGDHVIVLWDQSGHGYLVSVHGYGMTEAALVRAAIELARSTVISGRAP